MGQVLCIDGAVEQAAEYSVQDLNLLPDECQLRDIGQLIPNRSGEAVRLSALLSRLSPDSEATHLTLHASRDGFAASIPLELVKDVGLVLYQNEGEPLSPEQGGPFRFLIENAAPCKTAELDACANVKFLDRIELTVGPGKDTR